MNTDLIAATSQSSLGSGRFWARNYKFVVLAALYVAQAIPASFFDTVMPVVLRRAGMDLDTIGLLKWVAIPAALKFLWAPIVDKYGYPQFGNYKTWIFPMQVITILCALALTQFDWVAEFALLMAVAATWTVAAATQDIGVDGLAVRSLDKTERPFGVSLQQFSVLVGAIVGGGAMIVSLDDLGFDNAIFIITVVLLVPLIALLRYREPAAPVRRETPGIKSLWAIFRRAGMAPWMVQVVLLIAGSALAASMVAPMLVDQGLDLTEFGFLYGGVFPGVGAAGAVVAPLLIRRFGRKNTLIGSAALLCLDLANLVFIDQFQPPVGLIFAMLGWGVFTKMLLLVGISTVFMDLCRNGTAATDWTVQMSVLALAGAVFGGLGGFLAQHFGYTALFLTALIMTATGLAIVVRRLDDSFLAGNGASFEPATPGTGSHDVTDTRP